MLTGTSRIIYYKVALGCPVIASHNRAVLSFHPVAIVFPSGEKAMFPVISPLLRRAIAPSGKLNVV